IRFVLHFLKKTPQCQLAITASSADYIVITRSQINLTTKACVINSYENLNTENPDIDIRLINPSFSKSKLTDNNNFKIPSLLKPEHSAVSTKQVLQTKKFESHFTKIFTIILNLIAALPYKLYINIAKKMI
ncbi:oxidoreductase, partial [Francisella tularensis]|nr:oxidoreductase [Francisella tularensis]